MAGQSIASYHATLNAMRGGVSDRDASGGGLQTYDLRTAIHAVTAIETARRICWGNSWTCRFPRFWARAGTPTRWRCWVISLHRRPAQDRPALCGRGGRQTGTGAARMTSFACATKKR